jgi:hypothetical protein
LRRPQKRSPSLGGASGACPADRPPAANRHYLQLDGTYLVGMVPAVAVSPCAVAVALADDAQAQSMLPEDDATIAALAMFGVSTNLSVVAVS